MSHHRRHRAVLPMADAHAAVAAHMNLTAVVFGVGNVDDSPGIAPPTRLWPGTRSCIVMSATGRSHGTLVP